MIEYDKINGGVFMNQGLSERLEKGTLNRRDFLWLASVSSVGFMAGCAVNPVTGESQLMLMSTQDEIALDKAYSPHQFSADYGISQDTSLNHYIEGVGKKMAALTHRPEMPYSFQVVNANYVNAYAFPGGSIAITRGILLSLEDEAELAALIGHELGHVNARHTSSRMSKQQLIGAAVSLGSVAIAAKNEKYAALAAGLGSIGAGALLAKYSRDDERQADQLGMEYMVKAGYSPQGMVGLMDMLKSLSSHQPNVIEMMFASHPMSDERYATAKNRSEVEYVGKKALPRHRDRYMDKIAALRKIEPAIKAMQNGEKEMMQQKYPTAEIEFKSAVKKAPKDYSAHMLLSKCYFVQEKFEDAAKSAETASAIYPEEAQGHHLKGISHLSNKKYQKAYDGFLEYEQILPGNPNTMFLKGFSQENMQNKPEAAKEYMRYLKEVNQGEQAQHAYKQLVAWGYLIEDTETKAQ